MTNTAQNAVTPVYRADGPLITVEELLQFLGYDYQNGQWIATDEYGTVLIGVDIQRGFCKGGNLATPWGDEVVEPINEVATYRNLWHVRARTRDYHPYGVHCSFSTAYRAYQNLQVPHFMTADEFEAMGKTDADVLTPQAIAIGMNIRDILLGLKHPDSNGGLMVWVGGHCEEATDDSKFHPNLDDRPWDFVKTKGWRYPNWEEYGVFYAVLGYVLSNNGFHEDIQNYIKAFPQRVLGTNQPVKEIKRAAVAGLVSEYCDVTSAMQAQERGYDVLTLIDCVRPFDPDGEALAFGRQLDAGHKFVSNEVLREANTILAAQYGVVA